MTTTCVLMTDMAILVVIFALGFLAKSFPKGGRGASSHSGPHSGGHSGSRQDSSTDANIG